jgi:hypothetical protein
VSEDLTPEHLERLARGLWWLPEAGDCEAVAAEMGTLLPEGMTLEWRTGDK